MENPIIYAHRGASAYAPENTMAAFQKAYEYDADGIELDVKCSRDGEMVVIHDQTLDRTTNGKGFVIEQTAKELRALDAGSFYSESYKGERIPLLVEVLETFSSKMIINIELTNYKSPMDGLAEKAARLVKKIGLGEKIIFSSFNPVNLLITRKIVPEVPVALLAIPGGKGWLARSELMRWISREYIHPFFLDAGKDYIEKQHAKGRKVNVWTVNDEMEIRRLIENEVDGIITDDPILTRKMVAQ